MFNIIFVISKIYLLLFVFCFTADSCEIDQFPKPTQIKGYYHNLIYLPCNISITHICGYYNNPHSSRHTHVPTTQIKVYYLILIHLPCAKPTSRIWEYHSIPIHFPRIMRKTQIEGYYPNSPSSQHTNKPNFGIIFWRQTNT